MRISTLQNLSAIPTSFRWVVRHRGLVAGLAALWAILMTLAPWVQMKVGIPHQELTSAILVRVFTLPIEFYLLPMLLAYVDSEFHRNPANPREGWQRTFESRGAMAALAQLLLFVAVMLGTVAFIIPGVVIMILLGWMPMYLLLRGGSITHAARWSLSIMVKEWRRVILAVLPVFGIYVVLIFGLVFAITRGVPEHTLWLRFRHPYFWLFNLLTSAVNIWVSLALLAIFHKVENEAMLKSEDV